MPLHFQFGGVFEVRCKVPVKPYDKLKYLNTNRIIKTADLLSAGIYYADIQKLLSEGVLEKVSGKINSLCP